MKPFACNLCGSPEFDNISRPMAHQNQPLSVVRCRRCGLKSANPMPEPAHLDARYTKDYFQCDTPIEGGYEDYLLDEPINAKTFRGRWALFAPFLAAGGARRALDVGCATGVFLNVLRENGWNASGLEISDFARGLAEKKGFRVSGKKLEETDYEPGSFDLITMWDVIEHFHDPASALRICRRLLKPGGILVISTPDASAPFARLTGSFWMGYRSIGEHVYFFGQKTMRAMLSAAGFETVRATAVGKYLRIDRLLARLAFYTRVFRPLESIQRRLRLSLDVYVNSGDTMCVVARARDEKPPAGPVP